MLKRCKKSEQSRRIYDSLAKICRDDIDKIFPAGVVELEKRAQKVADKH